MTKIDLNADLGEGIGDDAKIMPLISSCSIACGGHFGTTQTIEQTIKLAKNHNIKVGAHPSFPDKANFGRKIMSLSAAELKKSLDGQLKKMIDACQVLNVTLNHVKPHGALYNLAAIDEKTAEVVIASILDTGLLPTLYAPKNSILYNKAKKELPVAAEAFIDRRYTDNLQLVSRLLENATIDEPEQAWQQLKGIVAAQTVQTISGKMLSLEANTFCVHSDNPSALGILEFIHKQLQSHKITID